MKSVHSSPEFSFMVLFWAVTKERGRTGKDANSNSSDIYPLNVPPLVRHCENVGAVCPVLYVFDLLLLGSLTSIFTRSML